MLEQSVGQALAEAVGVERVKPVLRCGGGDSIAAQREQWNDGSNALCIQSGHGSLPTANLASPTGLWRTRACRFCASPAAS